MVGWQSSDTTYERTTLTQISKLKNTGKLFTFRTMLLTLSKNTAVVSNAVCKRSVGSSLITLSASLMEEETDKENNESQRNLHVPKNTIRK